MSDKKICIVDDDTKLVTLIKRYLAKNGYNHVDAIEGSKLVEMKKIDYDLIILDIMMPDIDGFEVCKKIRKISSVFIIFLSAKTESFDKIVGLEIGADDFITKPFEPRELLARINSLFRRFNQTMETPDKKSTVLYEFNEFCLNRNRQELTRKNKTWPLTTYEFVLLDYFCENTNIILSRRQIEQYLEDNEFISYGRNVDIGISRLRKKLEDNSKKPEILKTVWGRGYQLAATKKH